MKFTLTIILIFLVKNTIGQSDEDKQTIGLSNIYSKYIFFNTPSKKEINDIEKNYPFDDKFVIHFIRECIQENNDILSTKYLSLPDTTTLKTIYIINALHQNPNKKNIIEPHQLVDSLKKSEIDFNSLTDVYYSIIFTSATNKNKPFNLSKINFKLDNYGLNTSQLKAIFYLRCMESCGKQIRGYMNSSDSSKYRTALNYIEKFPLFNDEKYFYYTDLFFDDFEIEIFNDRGIESYKKYFVNNLYITLFSHYTCLSQIQDKTNELWSKSILSKPDLYKYTQLKERLEEFSRNN